MNKLATRVGAAVALVAGATALSTGTSFASDTSQIPNQSTQQGVTSALGKLGGLTSGLTGNSAGSAQPQAPSGLLGGLKAVDGEPGTDNSQEDPSDEKPGDSGNGNSGDPTDNPNPGPLPPAPAPTPIPAPNPTPTPAPQPQPDKDQDAPQGNQGDPVNYPSSKKTAAEAAGLPFCPPVKDINLGIEGMRNSFVFPFVGGTIEGVPDIVNDMKGICLNLDYPSSLLSPGNEIPAELFSADHGKGETSTRTEDGGSGQGDGNGNGNGGLAAGLL
ncbi:hypothetical protein [Streptomyces sp. 5-10]|uniref:hypothetical protein n=1 Tax=Streptomyces sp. 5-10 TaxID=878925 RepID=UPI00168BD794|nr:hypothetical protein [Streptomyces sp. 5-10]MBD3004549.1 hypothetical protein [Streptomyces sp. 5-10]